MGTYLILGLPLFAALLTLILRNRPRAALISGLIAVLLIWLMLLLIPLPASDLIAPATAETAAVESLAAILGRTFALTAVVRSLLLWLYPALALVFLLSWLEGETAAVISSALASISFLTAALLAQPPTLGALLLIPITISLLPVVNALSSAPPLLRPPASSGLQFLLFTALAIPPLLLVGWMVESGQGGQSSAQFGFLLASLMLLGGFPFTIWVTAVARHALLSALPLIFAIVQTGIILFLFSYLNTTPALARGQQYQEIMQWSAAATTLLAALLLFRAADWREIIGRLLLFDMGLLLLTLATPTATALQDALWLLAGRFVSLMLACSGLHLWQRQAAVESPDESGGYRLTWSFTLLVYGCCSLLGLPLTPGFSGRWLVLSQVATPWLTAVVFFALALAILALLRFLSTHTNGYAAGHSTNDADQTQMARIFTDVRGSMNHSDGEPHLTKWLVGVAIFIGLLLTLLPSFFGRYATHLNTLLQ